MSVKKKPTKNQWDGTLFLRKCYINGLTVWEPRSLCNLNAVSVTKIGPADRRRGCRAHH